LEALFNILIALAIFVVLGVLFGVAHAFFPSVEKEEERAPEENKETGLRAFVRCRGADSKKRYTYADATNCEIAATLYGGMTVCPTACLGFGSCVSACRKGALSVKGGVACVDEALCDGCGECIDVCPRSSITLIPKGSVAVACRSCGAEYEVDRVCVDACIGCGACENTCKYGAIKLLDNLATIDYEKCTSCAACAEVCERSVISAPKKEEEPEIFDENEYFEISEELEE